jgi:signal peptidase II
MKQLDKMKQLWKRKEYVILVIGMFCINYFLDRITKHLAVKYIKGRGLIKLFNNLMYLVYAENDGAFLSLGSDWNIYVKYIVLIIIPILICITALFYLSTIETRIYRILIGSSIMGGGLANLIDRLFNEFKVIDFMNFGIGNIRTGILNVADLSVTFGAILLLIMETNYMKNEKVTK